MPYIPKAHEKYNMLPICQKYNVEIFVWDNKLFKKNSIIDESKWSYALSLSTVQIIWWVFRKYE